MFSIRNWPLRGFSVKGEHFENFATLILRGPGLMLIDQWSHISSDKLWPQTSHLTDIFSAFIFNFMLVQGLIILILPLPKLVTMYMHYISLAALTAASLLSRHYVLNESQFQEPEKEPIMKAATSPIQPPTPTHSISSTIDIINISPHAQYALKFAREFRPPGLSSEVPAYQFAERALIGIGLFVDSIENENEMLCILRQLAMLAVHSFIATCVAFFMDVESNAKRAFLAIYCLPVVIRLSGFAQSDLLLIHNCATAILILATIYYVLSWAPNFLSEIKFLYLYSLHEIETLSLGHFIMDVWSRLFVPSQFFVFWLGHVLAQLHALLIHPDLVQNSGVYSDEWYMVFLCAISQICDSPLTLAGTCVAMSYVSAAVLAATKIFIQSYRAYAIEQNPHAGLTEGLTMGLLAAQTGLIRIKMPQRLAAMSVILFVVVASLVQSIYETTEPMLLALSANKDRNVLRHFKMLLLCFFLFAFPLYMTFVLCYIFDIDFWLLVVLSTCVMTSVQVVGLLVIYCFFLYDAAHAEPWENLDDFIYYARAVVRCLEFFVAVFVVCAGFHESLVGQWSWSNSAVLVVHCYFNVWQRLQTGWVSFLRRREAAKHIDALPSATDEQLAAHNDVCAICYQSMSSGVRVTHCRHLFHGSCLRKWFYVQETCPMCSSSIATSLASQTESERAASPANTPAANAPQAEAGDPRRVHFLIDPNQSSGSTESNEAADDSEETSEGRDQLAGAQPRALVDPMTSVNSNFDNLLHRAQRDVRQAKLRERQVRHSRSKSDSLAQIIE